MAADTDLGAPQDYPVHWESDVVLADGGTVHLRPIRPDDETLLVKLWERLSAETIYFRFHQARGPLSDDERHYFANVDYEQRMALVAELGGDLVAVARYDRLGADPTAAEVAFTVVDSEHGRGIGTLCFEHLAAIAREHGIERFVAYVLTDNYSMLGLFESAGFELQKALDGNVVEVHIPLELSDAALAAIEEREVRAGAESMARLLRPRSIAVVGAGRERGGIGHEIFRNLVAGEFEGPVTPVHPTAGSIASVTAFPSVLDIPHEVDLVVVAVPAEKVLAVAEDCARKGVRSLVVITSGFAEMGRDGAAAEKELVAFTRRNGMRLVGPNCLGVVNTDPAVSMNATFAPNPPVPGRVGFVSQSGALGIAILGQAGQLGLGVSTFLSIGNRADVSANDLLEYWEHDDATDVALLYIESFGNPRNFGRLARRVSKAKPIVAVKSGRTLAGSRAAQSHTAAMAKPDETVDALFRQAGVIRVDTLAQLFDVARVIVCQPLPAGRRVAVIGNGGGPAILTADACERSGLFVHELSEATRARLAEVLSPRAAIANPIDLGADATPEQYEQALQILLSAPEVDALVVGFTPPLVVRTEDVSAAIVAAVEASPKKPVLANLIQSKQAEGMLGREAGPRVPYFAFPDSAVLALARLAWYHEWRTTPSGEVPDFADIDVGAARAVVEAALQARPEGGWLTAHETAAVAQAFGIPMPPTHHVESAADALAAARVLREPFALKATGEELAHKTDVGGVRLDLRSPEEVAGAYVDMAASIESMSGAVVQPMVADGVETILGVVQDPDFGPLVMFGMGGTAAELFGDRDFRIVPVTDRDADELIHSVRGAPLLTGYRGSEPCDMNALRDLVIRVGILADALNEVAEMDLNPVIAMPQGVSAVDVKIRVAPARPIESPGVRRLL